MCNLSVYILAEKLSVQDTRGSFGSALSADGVWAPFGRGLLFGGGLPLRRASHVSFD